MPDADVGFTPKGDDVGFVPKAQPAEQPGVLRRLLSAYQEGSRGIREEQMRRNPGGGLLDKDSGDLVAGISTFLSGIQGRQPGSAEQEQRLARFRGENPLAAPALGLAGGLASPVPGVPAAKAAEAAPVAAAAAAPAIAEEVAGGGAQAAANVYEQLARGAKATKIAAAIRANATAHLGADTTAPKFAETISGMSQEWRNGMAAAAGQSVPSEETWGEVVKLLQNESAQAALAKAMAAKPAIELSPAVAAALKEETPSAASILLRKGADALRSIPKGEATLSGFLLGAMRHGNMGRAAAEALAFRYGPQAAAVGLDAAARAPGVAGVTVAQGIRGAVGPSEVAPEDDLGFVPRGQAQDPRTSSIPPGAGFKDYGGASYFDPDRAAYQRAGAAVLRGSTNGSYQKSDSGSFHDPRYETGPETYAQQLHSTTNVLAPGTGNVGTEAREILTGDSGGPYAQTRNAGQSLQPGGGIQPSRIRYWRNGSRR